MKLSLKIFLLYLVFTFFIVIPVGYFLYLTTVNLIQGRINENLQDKAKHAMDKIDRVLYERYSDLEEIAKDPVLINEKSKPSAITERLIEIRNKRKSYISLSFYDENCLKKADTSGLNIGSKCGDSVWIQDIFQHSKLYSSGNDIYTSSELGRRVLVFAAAIKNTKGEFIGSVAAHISLETIHQIIANSIDSSDGDIYVDLINSQDVILYSNHAFKNKDYSYALNGNKILSPEENTIIVQAEEKGFLDYHGNQWTITLQYPKSKAFQPLHEIQMKAALIGSSLLLVSLVLIYFLSQKAIAPLVQLKNTAIQFGQGNLDIRIEYTSRDEIGALSETFNQMAGELELSLTELDRRNKELKKLNTSYGRFVPHDYMKFLSRNSILDVYLGDNVATDMTVVFSDIRSFTTLSETMTPQENFNFVNAYFRRVSPKVREHNGIIVKYVGDAIMAVFKDKVEDAIDSAISQLEEINLYNISRIKKGYLPIQSGLGIHTGFMMLGMVGETHRMQGDAFSDHVNLAARLEGLTKHYGASIIISSTVYAKLQDKEKYIIQYLDRVRVKGRKQPIEVYEVLNGREKSNLQKKLLVVEDFKKAVNHYLAGDMKNSAQLFDKIAQILPEDKTIQTYQERIRYYQKSGLPENWDGVYDMLTK